MSASHARGFARAILKPKIGIPLVLVVALFCSPWLIRGMRLARVPKKGAPFDLQAFGAVTVADPENAFVAYRLAVSKLAPRSAASGELEKALAGFPWTRTTAGANPYDTAGIPREPSFGASVSMALTIMPRSIRARMINPGTSS